MGDAWLGKPVSINCGTTLGVFQGIIKDANAGSITITRVFRNGVPLNQQDKTITLAASDILKMDLIPSPSPSKHSNSFKTFMEKTSSSRDNSNLNGSFVPLSSLSNHLNNIKLNISKSSPPKRGDEGGNTNSNNNHFNISGSGNQHIFSFPNPPNVSSYNNIILETQQQPRNVSKAIDIPSKSNSNTPFKTDKRKNRQQQNDQTFGTSVDDPTLDEDFDFEKNLALFDKQAIWDEINGAQKPDIVRQANNSKQSTSKQNNQQAKKPSKRKTYRHDENILVAEPTKFRQIEVESKQQEYVTDVGLVIPSISIAVRNAIFNIAEINGLTWERLYDNFARSATEMAILLIGGARRLIPTNHHQWPTIVIICDQSYEERYCDLGLAIGRHLSTHGLKTFVYLKFKTETKPILRTNELHLYKATENIFTNSVNDLPLCDLIIISSINYNLNQNLVKWINMARAPILAVDPPPSGYTDITAKCAVVPILPLDDLMSSCGKLYLANLGIPDKYFREAGIKYRSPFGHKTVIPIHDIE